MSLGPVQVLVVGFKDPQFDGTILEELRRLREQEVIRLLDLVCVAKDRDGTLSTIETGELSPALSAEFGALAGALIGLGADGTGEEDDGGEPPAGADVWYPADVVEPGTAAAVALIEHRWAVPLRDAIERAGGAALADAWVHPTDVAAMAAPADADGIGAS